LVLTRLRLPYLYKFADAEAGASADIIPSACEWGAGYGKGTGLAPEYNLSQQSTNAMTTEIAVRGSSVASVKGTVLAEKDVHAHNDFANPNVVKPRPRSRITNWRTPCPPFRPPASLNSRSR
jgi:hypothetical protein